MGKPGGFFKRLKAHQRRDAARHRRGTTGAPKEERRRKQAERAEYYAARREAEQLAAISSSDEDEQDRNDHRTGARANRAAAAANTTNTTGSAQQRRRQCRRVAKQGARANVNSDSEEEVFAHTEDGLRRLRVVLGIRASGGAAQTPHFAPKQSRCSDYVGTGTGKMRNGAKDTFCISEKNERECVDDEDNVEDSDVKTSGIHNDTTPQRCANATHSHARRGKDAMSAPELLDADDLSTFVQSHADEEDNCEDDDDLGDDDEEDEQGEAAENNPLFGLDGADDESDDEAVEMLMDQYEIVSDESDAGDEEDDHDDEDEEEDDRHEDAFIDADDDDEDECEGNIPSPPKRVCDGATVQNSQDARRVTAGLSGEDPFLKKYHRDSHGGIDRSATQTRGLPLSAAAVWGLTHSNDAHHRRALARESAYEQTKSTALISRSENSTEMHKDNNLCGNSKMTVSSSAAIIGNACDTSQDNATDTNDHVVDSKDDEIFRVSAAEYAAEHPEHLLVTLSEHAASHASHPPFDPPPCKHCQATGKSDAASTAAAAASLCVCAPAYVHPGIWTRWCAFRQRQQQGDDQQQHEQSGNSNNHYKNSRDHLSVKAVNATTCVLPVLTFEERGLLDLLLGYPDVVDCRRSWANASSRREIFVLHMLNHWFKARAVWLEHEAMLRQRRQRYRHRRAHMQQIAHNKNYASNPKSSDNDHANSNGNDPKNNNAHGRGEKKSNNATDAGKSTENTCSKSTKMCKKRKGDANDEALPGAASSLTKPHTPAEIRSAEANGPHRRRLDSNNANQHHHDGHSSDVHSLSDAEYDDHDAYDEEDAYDDTLRDRGFGVTRLLVLLPMRNIALRYIHTLLDLLAVPRARCLKLDLLESDFREVEEAMDPLFVRRTHDYRRQFDGNIDDSFCVGLRLSSTRVRLYSHPLNSDILVCSPLGLRRRLERSADLTVALASVEVCVIDEAHVLLQQNWQHVQEVLSLLNKRPQDTTRGLADLRRVYSWALAGQAGRHRQTILSSAVSHAHMLSCVRQSCVNNSGRVVLQRVPEMGILSRVTVPVRQHFVRMPTPAALTAIDDERWAYFTGVLFPGKVIPLLDRAVRTILLVPSYLDFVRVRQFMHREHRERYAAICEYTSTKAQRKALGQFSDLERPLLILTERFYFFKRYFVKMAEVVVFYSPPIFADCYTAFVNRLVTTSPNAFVLTLYCRYDTHEMNRLVGSARLKQMLEAELDIVSFLTT